MWWPVAKPSCPPRGCFELSPAQLFAPGLLLTPLPGPLPTGAGARRDSFPRAICASDALSHLLPSHGDSNPSCSTGRALNQGAAAPEDPGGIRLRSASSTPRSAQTPGAPSPQPPPWGCGHRGMLHCHCHTSSLSAQLLFSGSTEIRIRAIGITPELQPPCPPRCLHHQLPLSPRAVGSAEIKEMFSWKTFIPSRSFGKGVPGQPPAMP